MQFEVEQKYPVPDLAEFQRRLTALGAMLEEAESQADLYFAHPARDFAKTDEALRIRRIGPRNFMTYKGPKLDLSSKTRREIEFEISSGPTTAQACGDLLAALGFRLVREVRKNRRGATLTWAGHTVHAALDDVERLGAFVELEIMADEAQVEAAKGALASLSAALELTQSERRSYLELLLERPADGV